MLFTAYIGTACRWYIHYLKTTACVKIRSLFSIEKNLPNLTSDAEIEKSKNEEQIN